jgi:hypothetical protein
MPGNQSSAMSQRDGRRKPGVQRSVTPGIREPMDGRAEGAEARFQTLTITAFGTDEWHCAAFRAHALMDG